MKKFVLLLVFVAAASFAKAQTTMYDYLRIQVSQTVILVVTESETRTVEWSLEKGEGTLVERQDIARSRTILSLVMEYERQGWELFTVLQSHGENWVMRKPKQ